MNVVDSNLAIEKLVEDNEMVLVYFGSKGCGVCNVMKPKVEEILEGFPKIKAVEVDVEKSMKAAAAYNVFTIPVVLLFAQGKETMREARHISIPDIRDKIERYYNMIFE